MPIAMAVSEWKASLFQYFLNTFCTNLQTLLAAAAVGTLAGAAQLLPVFWIKKFVVRMTMQVQLQLLAYLLHPNEEKTRARPWKNVLLKVTGICRESEFGWRFFFAKPSRHTWRRSWNFSRDSEMWELYPRSPQGRAGQIQIHQLCFEHWKKVLALDGVEKACHSVVIACDLDWFLSWKDPRFQICFILLPGRCFSQRLGRWGLLCNRGLCSDWTRSIYMIWW